MLFDLSPYCTEWKSQENTICTVVSKPCDVELAECLRFLSIYDMIHLGLCQIVNSQFSIVIDSIIIHILIILAFIFRKPIHIFTNRMSNLFSIALLYSRVFVLCVKVFSHMVVNHDRKVGLPKSNHLPKTEGFKGLAPRLGDCILFAMKSLRLPSKRY